MAERISLSPEDPTIFAKCPVCCKAGTGVKIGDIFCKAYTPRRWKRDSTCENCGTQLVILYEVS